MLVLKNIRTKTQTPCGFCLCFFLFHKTNQSKSEHKAKLHQSLTIFCFLFFVFTPFWDHLHLFPHLLMLPSFFCLVDSYPSFHCTRFFLNFVRFLFLYPMVVELYRGRGCIIRQQNIFWKFKLNFILSHYEFLLC